MSGTQREWWAKLRDYFDGNERFVSEPGRTEREKAPVREFLKYLGVEFREEELAVPPKDGEVEVRFRDARLQNVERMEPARRRHEEVRQFAEHVRTAAPEAPRCDSVPMRTAELLREVVKALDKKSRKTANRASLDALVYVNIPGRHLHPGPDVIEEDTSIVAQFGWRSVSVLWPPYAVVMCAKSAAPRFLRMKTGRIIRYSGIAWEGAALPAGETSVAHVAWSALANFAVVGYVALGALVLATRAMRDAFGALGTRLAHEVWVVEAESATPAGWSVVSTCVSLQDATARLGHLAQRFAGVPVFERRRWRLREVTTGEVVPGELFGCWPDGDAGLRRAVIDG